MERQNLEVAGNKGHKQAGKADRTVVPVRQNPLAIGSLCTGHHYVIENGGHLGHGIGMISATPVEKAFERDAEFFVLSPPKDSDGRSTRYLVLQRALASLGMYYREVQLDLHRK